MPKVKLDRSTLAQSYARSHAATDPAIVEVWYLPTKAPEREIRLIEVNSDLAEMIDDCIEPVDFGIARGTDDHHVLSLLDVSPGQFMRMQSGSLKLPHDWSLTNAKKVYGHDSKR